MVVGILQARMSSSRLPGKVLKPIMGRPMLQYQLERLEHVTLMDKLIVATSDQADDTPIAKLCDSLGVGCFRGNLHDVLDRYYQAAKSANPDIVVRLTGDCPVTSAAVIDRAIKACIEGGFDYLSNTIEPTFPHGLDVEVFPFKSLEIAWKEASEPYEREHVTPYLYQNPTRFNVANLAESEDLSSFRWTVDEPEDFELIKAVYEALYADKPDFGTADIIAFLKGNPQIAKLNEKFSRPKSLVKPDAQTYLTV